MSNRFIRLLTVLTVVVAAFAGGAIAVQAASSDTSVQACATRSGRLTLANSKGHCARGTRRVKINQQGPRGATGKQGATGKTGETGRPGKDGVGATSGFMDVTYTPSSFDVSTTKVGTFGGYRITMQCELGQTDLRFDPGSSTQSLYIHGTADATGYADFDTFDNDLTFPSNVFGRGYNSIAMEDDAELNQQFLAGEYFVTSSLTAHLLLSVGTSTATLDLYLLSLYNGGTANPYRCQADAQLTPSTTQTG